ncbi:MAG: HAD-IIA family hydrolase [Actinomycetota bacterium]|nr:HAD-IIA family hydrolase [Actinomycetota bacterium]
MSVGDFDVLLFDLDGVVYVGEEAVPGAIEAIESARAQGARCIYVTNNASRTPAQVAAHLRHLGIPAQEADVISSSMAGATLVAEHITGGEVLAIGGEGVSAALIERGFTPVSTFSDSVQAVMQGYGPDVGWKDLAEATFAVRAGLPWIATNLDSTFPSARGIAPGNGALVQVVAQTAGRRPDAVAGKPEPALLREALRRTGAIRPLMIGDRLDTDMAAGARLGMPTLLVTTGISTATEAMSAIGELRPTYVSADLGCLLPDRHFLAVPSVHAQ